MRQVVGAEQVLDSIKVLEWLVPGGGGYVRAVRAVRDAGEGGGVWPGVQQVLV